MSVCQIRHEIQGCKYVVYTRLMNDRPRSLIGRLQRYAGQLKSSTLLVLVASLFALDLVVPDPLPFVDEIVLGIVTILVARWQGRRQEPPPAKPSPKDVTPPGGKDDAGGEGF